MPSRPLQPLAPDDLRIFTWNVNGIKPFLQSSITQYFKAPSKGTLSPGSELNNGDSKSHSLLKCLERWKWPHILCLQEVKISSTDKATQKAVQQAVRPAKGNHSSHAYRAFFSLPTDKVNARGFGGKLYGVCTLVREDLFASNGAESDDISANPVDWEREGRVIALALPNRKLLVLNVYAVNGTDYPYKNSNAEIVGTRHDFKRKFHSLLRDMVKDYQDKNWSVVVAGDINIAREPLDGFPGIRLGPSHVTNRQDFDNKFMKPVAEGGLGMIDSFRCLHGTERKYTYRSPNMDWGASCDRVDLILLTDDAQRLEVLKEADILDDEFERGPSDHLPSFVTLDLAAFAGASAKPQNAALIDGDDNKSPVS